MTSEQQLYALSTFCSHKQQTINLSEIPCVQLLWLATPCFCFRESAAFMKRLGQVQSFRTSKKAPSVLDLCCLRNHVWNLLAESCLEYHVMNYVQFTNQMRNVPAKTKATDYPHTKTDGKDVVSVVTNQEPYEKPTRTK